MNADIDIFSYTDYRKMLRDYYDAAKAKEPEKFSFRFLARRAGFTSPNFFHLVIKGKRNLGHESIHRFARVMGLNKREALFFESLVLFNQCTDPQEKGRAFESVISFREYRSSRKLVADQYEYFSHWYYPVIREMANLEGFREDPNWIARRLRPSITRAEAHEALERLGKLGLIARNGDGKLHQVDRNLATEKEVASTALVKFYQEMIRNGIESLNHTAGEREISGLTMSVSERQFEQVRAKMRELQEEIQKMIAQDGDGRPTKICQLNLQLFSLIQAPGRSS